jgi:hypothetical protein
MVCGDRSFAASLCSQARRSVGKLGLVEFAVRLLYLHKTLELVYPPLSMLPLPRPPGAWLPSYFLVASEPSAFKPSMLIRGLVGMK